LSLDAAEKRHKSFRAADFTFPIVYYERQSPIFIGETRKFGPRFALIPHCFVEFRFSSVAVTEKSAEMSIR